MQLRFKSALFSLPSLALLLASACGGKVVPTSAEGKGQSCADACQQAASCDKTIDADKCVKSCTDDKTLSLAGQEAAAKCSKDQDCAAPNPTLTLACILGEVGEVEASEAGKTFCTTSLDRLNECQLQATPGGAAGPAPTGELCSGYVSVAADEFLTGLNNCLDGSKTCEAAQLCVGIKLLPILLASQDPKPGDPGLVGLLTGLLGGSFEIPGGIPGGPPTPGDDPPSGTGGGTSTDPLPMTGGNPGQGGADPAD